MKICIIGLDDYPQLANHDAVQFVGGESVQHVLLARAWRDLGQQVSIIVHDEGQGRVQTIDGIDAIAAYRRTAGIPVLRFAHPRLTRLIGAMREVDADVYYQSPSAAATGVTAWFCRRYGKRSVVRIASDLGCIPGQQLIRYWRDRRMYDYGLRHADIVVAQTEHQRSLLRKHYGLSSARVNMVVEAPREQIAKRDIQVLWVANFRDVKRPETVFELARMLPHVHFTMAGGCLPGLELYFENMVRRALEIPNLTLLGAVPYGKVGALFSRARLFLNTSSMEGFPNTFLQSWIRGVPVVTFFDPDTLVKRLQLGVAADTLTDMAQAIDRLSADGPLRAAMGERARQFAEKEFSATHVAQQYLDLIEQGAAGSGLRYGTAG